MATITTLGSCPRPPPEFLSQLKSDVGVGNKRAHQAAHQAEFKNRKKVRCNACGESRETVIIDQDKQTDVNIFRISLLLYLYGSIIKTSAFLFGRDNFRKETN